MKIGLVPPGRIVTCGSATGKFLRMCGQEALVELTDGRRVMWSEAAEVELLSDEEEVTENILPRLEAELARLETFADGKYAQLGLTADTPCIELPKQLHPPMIRGALGERPSDAVLCRRCTTELCIRADHLFWGTRSDCQRDMCLRGLAKPGGKSVEISDTVNRMMKLRIRVQRLKSQVISQ